MDSRNGIRFIGYDESDAECDDKMRRFNQTEVDLVESWLRENADALLGQGKTISVITFYKEQFRKLMDVGDLLGLVKVEKKDGRENRRFAHDGFRIVTVDAAQGSEADIVVLSCVRCNRRGDIGFVKDRNRMCVALSRAKEQLIIVGSAKTLSRDPVWRSLYKSRH